MNLEHAFERVVEDHLECVRRIRDIRESVFKAALMLSEAIKNGGKIMICGNGGSAADAQHLAAEIVGRFETERRAYPAIALTTDTSILTAVANDYSYDEIFARQVEALGARGDVLVGLSTSGNSGNVIKAVKTAHGRGVATVALCGKDGGELKGLADCAIVVPSGVTARIQEIHIMLLHFFAMIIETGDGNGKKGVAVS